jgi:hypothetical protein
MSTFKHTPGPWVQDTRGYPHPDVKAASGRNIACTWGVNNQPKTKEAYEAQKQIARANARLIAAAPESHEANKLSLTVLCAIRAAGVLSHDTNILRDLDSAIGANRAAIAKATQEPQE